LARLLLVRHGETEMQSSLRYWGSTDVNLGETGIRQAEKLRDRLAKEKIDFAYSSCLKRAVLTASIITSSHSIRVAECRELREIDFGCLEGLDFNQVQQQFPAIAQKWIDGSPDLSYPRGESLAALDLRVGQFRSRLAVHTDSETVLVVAHSGVLRTLICQLLGLETSNRWKYRMDLASLSIIDTYENKSILGLLNDTSHLS